MKTKYLFIILVFLLIIILSIFYQTSKTYSPYYCVVTKPKIEPKYLYEINPNIEIMNNSNNETVIKACFVSKQDYKEYIKNITS